MHFNFPLPIPLRWCVVDVVGFMSKKQVSQNIESLWFPKSQMLFVFTDDSHYITLIWWSCGVWCLPVNCVEETSEQDQHGPCSFYLLFPSLPRGWETIVEMTYTSRISSLHLLWRGKDARKWFQGCKHWDDFCMAIGMYPSFQDSSHTKSMMWKIIVLYLNP